MGAPKTIAEAFLSELDVELPTTRRLLERVPSDRAAWKPHEKSFSLGHLAQLVARMPGWLTLTMRETVLDLGGAPNYTLEKTETLLAEFDRNVKEAREALAKAKDRDSCPSTCAWWTCRCPRSTGRRPTRGGSGNGMIVRAHSILVPQAAGGQPVFPARRAPAAARGRGRRLASAS